MIYEHKDFIKALALLHPEIEEGSLELIARRGLQGINRIMRSGQELILHNFRTNGTQEDWIKFFIRMTSQEQRKHALRNYYRKQRKKELNGREQSSTE